MQEQQCSSGFQFESTLVTNDNINIKFFYWKAINLLVTKLFNACSKIAMQHMIEYGVNVQFYLQHQVSMHDIYNVKFSSNSIATLLSAKFCELALTLSLPSLQFYADSWLQWL